MAYTMGLSRVTIPALPGLNSDAGADPENKGVVVFGTIDITTYTAGSEDVPIAEFGLSKMYGLFLQEAELELHVFSTPVSGANVLITATVINGGAEAGAVNLGVLNFMAFGEGATAGVENLTVTP
jgi:hypothetical protein